MVTASKVATVTGVSVLTGFLLYAVYFDHKRRHDPAFRSRLRKDERRSQREVKKAALQKEKEIDAYLQKVVSELNRSTNVFIPDEETFSSQVQVGEALAAQGAQYYLPAATAFYKALKFYPAPAELLMIYQKAVPEQCLAYVEKMVSLDPNLRINRNPQQDILSSFINDPSSLATAGGAAAGSSSRLEEIDDEGPKTPLVKSTNGSNSGTNGIEDGAPSVSSQEWEKVSQTMGEEAEAKVEQPAVATTSATSSDSTAPVADSTHAPSA